MSFVSEPSKQCTTSWVSNYFTHPKTSHIVCRPTYYVLPLAEGVARFIQKISYHTLDLLGFSNAIRKQIGTTSQHTNAQTIVQTLVTPTSHRTQLS